jgi:hypothetical protein
VTTGSDNIDIGNFGLAGEASTMRLGSAQTRTFVAGIAGVTVGGGTTVLINADGQLGTVVSSARYKRDIRDMGTRSQNLLRLRPVTFRYKTDPQAEQQYGLIAEEVVQVYPELVTKGSDGQVQSVQYHQMIPMLLNELQHQQREIAEQSRQLSVQAQEITERKTENAALLARLDRLENNATHATASVAH